MATETPVLSKRDFQSKPLNGQIAKPQQVLSVPTPNIQHLTIANAGGEHSFHPAIVEQFIPKIEKLGVH